MNKSFFLLPAKLALLVGLVAWLVHSGKLDFSKLSLLWGRPQWLAGLLLFFVLVHVPLSCLRWRALLAAQGGRLPLGLALRQTWIGNFFNLALPGAVGGDVVKAFYLIRREGHPKLAVVQSLVMDRLLGLAGFALLGLGFLPLAWPQVQGVAALGWVALVTLLLGLGVLLAGLWTLAPLQPGQDPVARLLAWLPLQRATHKLYAATRTYSQHPRALLASLGYSLLLQFGVLCVFFGLLNLLGGEIEFALLAVLLPLAMIFVALPLTPGGIGVGHAAFAAILAPAGVALGADLFNLFVLVQMLAFLGGAGAYLSYRQPVQAAGLALFQRQELEEDLRKL